VVPDAEMKRGRAGGEYVEIKTSGAPHRKAVASLAWSHDGELLASASADTTARIWKRARSSPDDDEETWGVRADTVVLGRSVDGSGTGAA